MNMKHFINHLACAMAICFALFIGSCQPDSDKPDFANMRIGKMNLTGAKQLALRTEENQSRAIDGQFLSAGLYKIDDKGNISAVGVYFTTDKSGKHENEYALRVAPHNLFQLTPNYILATDCEYYDVDGDIVRDKWIEDGDEEDIRLIKQAVPYEQLLVRLTDGKVWCVDNIIWEMGAKDYPDAPIIERVLGAFKEGPDGVLYMKYDRGGYRFNLTSDNPSFEQIVKLHINADDNIQIAPNGVIWSYRRGRNYESYNNWIYWNDSKIEFAWPHSGFQTFGGSSVNLANLIYEDEEMEMDLSFIREGLKLKREFTARFININERPFALCLTPLKLTGPGQSQGVEWVIENKLDVARLVELDISDSPGGVKPLGNCIKLEANPESVFTVDSYGRSETRPCVNIASIQIAGNHILTHGKGTATLIDLEKQEWRWLKTTGITLDLESGNIYDGKIFSLSSPLSWSTIGFGAYWFDLKTWESGFTPFNVQLPNYILNSNLDLLFDDIPEDDWKDGIIEFSGQNPATGEIEHIYIDITTGEATHETSKVKMFFATLIGLN